MLAVYVAGKTHDFLDVRTVQAIAQTNGHHITYDWTRTVETAGPDHEHGITPEDAREAAQRDLDGVMSADLVIALSNPKWCGSLIEIGAALVSGSDILFVGQPYQKSIFWASPNLYAVADLHAGGAENLHALLGALGHSRTMDLQDMLEDETHEYGLYVPQFEGRQA